MDDMLYKEILSGKLDNLKNQSYRFISNYSKDIAKIIVTNPEYSLVNLNLKGFDNITSNFDVAKEIIKLGKINLLAGNTLTNYDFLRLEGEVLNTIHSGRYIGSLEGMPTALRNNPRIRDAYLIMQRSNIPVQDKIIKRIENHEYIRMIDLDEPLRTNINIINAMLDNNIALLYGCTNIHYLNKIRGKYIEKLRENLINYNELPVIYRTDPEILNVYYQKHDLVFPTNFKERNKIQEFIINKINNNDINIEWIDFSNPLYLEKMLNKENIMHLDLFKNEAYTKDNIDILVKLLRNNKIIHNVNDLPINIKNNTYLIESLIKDLNFRSLNGLSEDVILSYKDLIYSSTKSGFIGFQVDYLPDSIKKNDEFLEILLNNKDLYGISLYSNEEFINKNESKLHDYILSGDILPIKNNTIDRIKNSVIICGALIGQGLINNLKEMNDSSFNEDNLVKFNGYIKNLNYNTDLNKILKDYKNYPSPLKSNLIIETIISKQEEVRNKKINLDYENLILNGDTISINKNFKRILNIIKNYDHDLINNLINKHLTETNTKLLWNDILDKDITLFLKEYNYIDNLEIRNELIEKFNDLLNTNTFIEIKNINKTILDIPEIKDLVIKHYPLNYLNNELITVDSLIYRMQNNEKININKEFYKNLNDEEIKLLVSKMIEYEYLDLLPNLDIYNEDLIINIILKLNSSITHLPSILCKSSLILSHLLEHDLFKNINNKNEFEFNEKNIRLLIEKLNNKELELDINLDNFSNNLIHNPIFNTYIFNKYMEGNKDLIVYLNEDIINENINNIIAEFNYDILNKIDYNAIPDILKNNKIFIYSLIINNKANLIKDNPKNIEIIKDLMPNIIENINNMDINSIKDFNSNTIKSSNILLKYLLENNMLDKIEGFNNEAFDLDNLDLLNNLILNNKFINLKLLPLSIIKKDQIIDAVINIERFDLLVGLLDKDIVYKKIDLLSNKFGVDRELLRYKLDYLYNKNNKVFETINLSILSNTFDNITREILEIISNDKEMSMLVLNISNDPVKFKIFKLISDYLLKYKNDKDIKLIMKNVLYNGLKSNEFNELFNNINATLNDEQMTVLLKLLTKYKNYFNIKEVSELNKNLYTLKKKQYMDNIKSKILASNISLNELKNELFIKYFNLSKMDANRIINIYCKNLDILREYGLSLDLYRLLNLLQCINNSNNIKALSNLYLCKSTNINPKYMHNINLEKIIKLEFTELYNKNLYKLKESDLTKNDKLKNLTYNNKQIKVYEISSNFSMITHSINGNSNNYKLDYDNKLNTNNTLNTQYINNSLISPLKTLEPILGFSNIESGINDISCHKDKNDNYMLPNMLIEYTRNNHNNIEIDTRYDKGITNIKIYPSYVVYFTNDTSKDNFDESNVLWSKTVKAANDFNIPIVIVNKETFIKKEYREVLELEKQFVYNLNPNLLKQIFDRYLSNSMSTNFYNNNVNVKEELFSPYKTYLFYQRTLSLINNLRNIEIKKVLINALKEIFINEKNKLEELDNMLNYEDEINNLNNLQNNIKTNEKVKMITL